MEGHAIEERLIRSPSGLSARLQIVATEQGTRYRVAFIGKGATDPSLFSMGDLHDLAHLGDSVYRAAEEWADEQHANPRNASAGKAGSRLAERRDPQAQNRTGRVG